MVDADTRRLRKVAQRTVDCLRYVEDPAQRSAARSDFTLAFDPPTVLALLDEIDVARADIEGMQRAEHDVIRQQRNEIDRLARRVEIAETMRRYGGGHHNRCPMLNVSRPAACNCGFADALAAFDALRTERDDAIIDVENGKRRLRDLDWLARRVEVGERLANAVRFLGPLRADAPDAITSALRELAAFDASREREGG